MEKFVDENLVRHYAFIILAGIVFVWFLPINAFAHSGDTAYPSCHQCITNCEYYGYYYNEYHCHVGDEYYKPLPSDKIAKCNLVYDRLASMSSLESAYRGCIKDETIAYRVVLVQEQMQEQDRLAQQSVALLAKQEEEYKKNLAGLAQQQKDYNSLLETIKSTPQPQITTQVPSCGSGYYSNGQCFCNSGSTFYNNTCMTISEQCKILNGGDSKLVGSISADGKPVCSCAPGYIWNTNQCVAYVLPDNNLKVVADVVKTRAKIAPATSTRFLDNVTEPKVSDIKTNSVDIASTTLATSTATEKTQTKIQWYKKVWKFFWRF